MLPFPLTTDWLGLFGTAAVFATLLLLLFLLFFLLFLLQYTVGDVAAFCSSALPPLLPLDRTRHGQAPEATPRLAEETSLERCGHREGIHRPHDGQGHVSWTNKPKKKIPQKKNPFGVGLLGWVIGLVWFVAWVFE